MARSRIGARLLAVVRDPWALLLSTFGGGTVWAFGASIPQSVGTAAVMLGTAATVGALTGAWDLPPARGTQLYAATRKAVETVRAGAGDDTINAIVVMTRV